MRIRSRFGSAEIGASHYGFCFPVSPDSPEEWIGVDFGLKPDDRIDWPKGLSDGSLPEPVSPNLKHLLMSHSHLDHADGLPAIFRRYEDQGKEMFTIYMSEISLRVSEELLWLPSIRIADHNKLPRPFEPEDILGVKRHIRLVGPGEMFDLGSCRVLAMGAGHIPGAFYWILIPKNGADPVFVSGDISFRKLGLTPPADPIPLDFKKFSLAVVESTYLGQPIPPRAQELVRLRDFAKRVLALGGTLIIPTFSIGLRDLEVGMDLAAHGVGPVYYDGTLKDAIHIYKQLGVVPASFNEKNFVRGHLHMEWLMSDQKPKVIIATGGMMPENSTAFFYGSEACRRKEDAIAFIGYQAKGTPGQIIFDSLRGEMVRLGDRLVRRECAIGKFKLSLHTDGPGIERIIRRLNPEVVVLNHGNASNIKGWIEFNAQRFPSRMVCAEAGLEVNLP